MIQYTQPKFVSGSRHFHTCVSFCFFFQLQTVYKKKLSSQCSVTVQEKQQRNQRTSMICKCQQMDQKVAAGNKAAVVRERVSEWIGLGERSIEMTEGGVSRLPAKHTTQSCFGHNGRMT